MANDSAAENLDAVPPDGEPQAPGGFDELPTEFDAWWDPAKANAERLPLQGQILGFQPRHDGKGFLYVVKLTESTMVAKGSGNDAQTLKLDAGAMIAVNETMALEALRPYVQHKGQIWVWPREKVPTKSGNDFWRMKINTKGRQGAIPAVATAANGEVPFSV